MSARPTGECEVCSQTFNLDKDGNINRHGTLGSTCMGSGQPPFISQIEWSRRHRQRLTVRMDEVLIGDALDFNGYSGVVIEAPEPKEVGSGRDAVQILLDTFVMVVEADAQIEVLR